MISLRRLAGLGLTPLLAGLAVASVVAVSFNMPGGSEASSHREAPLISADPQADTTDVYAFIAPDAPNMLTLVGNWIPLEEPAGGPNFYNFGDDVYYEFAIDNNGDAKEEVTYEFRFRTAVRDRSTFLYATGPITSLNDPDFNIRQFMDVYRQERNRPKQLVAKNLAVAPNNVGPVSTPNFDSLANAAIHNLPGGGKVFAGQRDDPFFVDLGGVFDLATIRMLPGNAGGGLDAVGGFNTNSIVLQVPLTQVTKCKCDPAPTGAAAVIGVWSDTYRNQFKVLGEKGGELNLGKKVQVSRLGNPLVNEVVIPLSKKDTFNASDPQDDGQFLPFVVNSDLAAKLNAVYNGIITPIPTTDRQDLVTVFLTGIPGLNQPPRVTPSEQLRLNVGIKPSSCATNSRLGVIGGDNCGFPNGRRLGDDVVDVAVRAVACGYGFNLGPCVDSAPNNALGDGVDANDKALLASFPYVPSPHSGFSHDHEHGTGIVQPVAAGFGTAGAVFALLIAGSAVATRLRSRRNEPAA
ncbi:MAG: DUF4331 domain-containing protein [Dehalococcoidia bacterium]